MELKTVDQQWCNKQTAFWGFGESTKPLNYKPLSLWQFILATNR